MAGIAFRGVTKRYRDGTEAVKQMDLEIADGEFMILVGPSGCGKTTALRMIAGLETITEGEMFIGDRRINDVSPGDRDIAMVFQNYALYPHMTVRENMGFALRMAQVKKAEIRRRVEEAAALLGLTDHLDRKPGKLSGGQRQRVAMGRAIVRAPDAFLMDEPLSNLDAKLRTQMRAQLGELQDRLGTTTVFVTHDQTEAMTLGDRVAVMRDGVIQQVGSPQHLYEEPANMFVAGFIGSPPMNFLEASLDDSTLRFPFGSAELPGELRRRLQDAAWQGGEIVAGVRPEDIDFAAEDRPDRLNLCPHIELVESMGSELYLHFDPRPDASGSEALMTDLPAEGSAANADRIIARVSAKHRVKAGERTPLAVDLTKLSLFDRKDGTCLTSVDSVGRPRTGSLVG
jgi:multiple sugar transport system ATP-binding protein